MSDAAAQNLPQGTTTISIVKILSLIQLQIAYGPSYALQLTGSAGKPPYKLSFSEYDFGPCLVQTAATKYYKTVLNFNNYNIFPMTY